MIQLYVSFIITFIYSVYVAVHRHAHGLPFSPQQVVGIGAFAVACYVLTYLFWRKRK